MTTLLTILNTAFEVYSLMIIAWVLMSWFPGAYQSKFGQWLRPMVEPYMRVFQRFIPTIFGLDFSPIVALIFLNLAQKGLWIILAQLMGAGY